MKTSTDLQRKGWRSRMSECLALDFLAPPKLELNTAPILIDLRKTLAVLDHLEVNDLRHQPDPARRASIA